MSQHHQRCVSHLEIVESYFRRPDVAFSFKGIPLTDKNNRFIKDLYTIMSCIWFDASTSKGLLNQRWAQSLIKLDVGKVVDAFKDIDYRLLTVGDDVASFNHWRRSTYPEMGQILGPLKVEMESFLIGGYGLRKLRTCLLFITRANFPDPVGLEEEAYQQWSTRNLCEVPNLDTEPEAMELSRIFPRRLIHSAKLRPKFGNGVTADLGKATDLESKYKNFKDDALLRYYANKVGFPTDALPFRQEGLERCGNLMFVPKALDRLRVVSPEPSSLMFYQRGTARWMLDIINTTPWRAHISLQHSELNAQLAMEGSVSGEYATIDLSAASDGVKYRYVKDLFRNTCLREALISVRSRTVKYGDSILIPNYYAPMGSGCCFEVETAFFASVVGSIMRQNRDRRAWRVYGDDIIVPEERYDQVIDRLLYYGFEVNQSKSFHGSVSFRESCGGDYFLGEDVTPVRVSRRWRGLSCDKSSSSAIMGNVDLANRLVDFPLARNRVVKALLHIWPLPLFSEDGSRGIYSPCPTNYRAKSRWNESLQRTEYLTGAVISHPTRGDEAVALFEWFRSKEVDRSPVAESATMVGPSKIPRWLPKWQAL